MRVEIDSKSGFCFGVVRAISEAEKALKESLLSESTVFSLGDIVHNRVEVQRLAELGLRPISHKDISSLVSKTSETFESSEIFEPSEPSEIECNVRLLIRAHGEPPATYKLAERLGIEIVDATCPVVAKLQQKIVAAYDEMQKVGGEVVLLGKRGHAEVVGLTGQVNDNVTVVESIADIENGAIDFAKPIYLLSQTTQSITLFEELAEVIKRRSRDCNENGAEDVVVCDTICRQVSSREEHLKEFVARFDVVIFVCGKKSSNGKVLFELCSAAKAQSGDSRCYNIESEEELDFDWFKDAESVGICGATSTPAWLMERVAETIKKGN